MSTAKISEMLHGMEAPLDLRKPVLIVIGKIDEWEEGYKPSDKSLMIYAVRNIVEEYLSDTVAVFSIAYDPTIICWFIQARPQDAGSALPLVESQANWKLIQHYVQETFELIQLTCKQLLNKQVSFFIGHGQVEWSEAAMAFERLKRLMSFHFDMRETILIDEQNQLNDEKGGAFNPDLALQLKKIALLEMMLENGRQSEFLQM